MVNVAGPQAYHTFTFQTSAECATWEALVVQSPILTGQSPSEDRCVGQNGLWDFHIPGMESSSFFQGECGIKPSLRLNGMLRDIPVLP